MADTLVLEASARKGMKVRVLSVPPNGNMAERHTHWSKKPAPQGLRVQVPLLSPANVMEWYTYQRHR